jgi:hypothetical protein
MTTVSGSDRVRCSVRRQLDSDDQTAAGDRTSRTDHPAGPSSRSPRPPCQKAMTGRSGSPARRSPASLAGAAGGRRASCPLVSAATHAAQIAGSSRGARPSASSIGTSSASPGGPSGALSSCPSEGSVRPPRCPLRRPPQPPGARRSDRDRSAAGRDAPPRSWPLRAGSDTAAQAPPSSPLAEVSLPPACHTRPTGCGDTPSGSRASHRTRPMRAERPIGAAIHRPDREHRTATPTRAPPRAFLDCRPDVST